MYRLRQECPWDREQTHESLKRYFIEETYEALEALDNKEWEHFKTELGDVLLHIVFHAIIAEESELFNIFDVINSLNNKMIRRHPHVFGKVKAESMEEVEENWEAIKLSEEGKKSYLDGIPHSLPALSRAQNLQRKAAAVGFDWPDTRGIREKLREEEEEFSRAVESGEKAAMEEELGDVLFTWVNLARHLDLSAEDALRKANRKFEKRFKSLEKEIRKQKKEIRKMSLSELDRIWDKIKEEET